MTSIKRILEIIVLILLAAFIGASVRLVYEIGSASHNPSSYGAKVNAVLSQLQDVAVNVSATSATVKQAAVEEQTQAKAAARELIKVAGDAHDLLAHSDLSLNCRAGHLGCDTDGVLVGAAGTVGDARADLRSAAAQIAPVGENLLRASSTLSAGLSDDMPLLHDSLLDLNQIGHNTEGITDDAHTETTLIVGKTRQAFAPQNKFLTVLKLVGGGTVTAAELFFYLTH